jgi:hypothetical protein
LILACTHRTGLAWFGVVYMRLFCNFIVAWCLLDLTRFVAVVGWWPSWWDGWECQLRMRYGFEDEEVVVCGLMARSVGLWYLRNW